MVRIQKRRDAMEKCNTTHCPRILRKLEKLKEISNKYMSTWSGGVKYQVLGPDGQFVVDMKERGCTCRRWQLTSIPCSHAISAIYYNKDRPENHLDECYTVATYLKTYSYILYPTQGRECWPKSDQIPFVHITH